MPRCWMEPAESGWSRHPRGHAVKWHRQVCVGHGSLSSHRTVVWPWRMYRSSWSAGALDCSFSRGK
eukprot:12593561-Alexandrium_andersonii.AAC.1